MVEPNPELVEFLKERSILKVLDVRVLKEICRFFEEINCGPGHLVFKQGDPADAIYIIKHGSVEVIQGTSPTRVIAYLTTGDCFGEMALLHDTVRNATIRVPEEAVVLKLPRNAFQELQAYFPEVTHEVTSVVNRRLSGKLPFNSPGLQGNLAFFDLPTVLQTVIASRQDGVLLLRGYGGKLVARLQARQGKLIYANFGHLTGEYAVYELLSRADPLDFIFEQPGNTEKAPESDKSLSNKEPHMLLIEGARRADELPKLMSNLGWPQSIFSPNTKQPDWTQLKPEQSVIAKRIWLLVEAVLPLQQLCEKITVDRYTSLNVLEEMVKLGLVKSAIAKPFGVSPEPLIQPGVATILGAINEISLRLSIIIGKDNIRSCLEQALLESASRYSNLQTIKLRPDTVTLDVRLASPEVSQSSSSVKALQDLTLTILKLASQCNLKNSSLS